MSPESGCYGWWGGWTFGFALATAALLVSARPSTAQEAEPPAVERAAVQQVEQQLLRLAVGNSALISAGGPLERVSIGNPQVADVTNVSPSEVLVIGQAPGTTTLLLWTRAGTRSLYSVRVATDAPMVEEEIRSLFPNEDIRVRAVGNLIYLSGTVGDARVADRAAALAASVAVGDSINIINDISVPRPNQVMLQVRFAEVSRNALDELGTSLLVYEGDNIATALGPGDVARSSEDDDAVAEVFSDAVNFFLFHRPSQVAGFFRALQEQGLFRSLAEPNLLVMSGDSASFLAGGEFPIPVLQGAGQAGAVTIQFKEFGVRLNFRPLVTPVGSIRLHVTPEVSALDFANGLTISGFQIPAITARRATTTVDLNDGQTFAIAGLVDNSMSRNVSKVPLLGDIPILGKLFSSETFRQNRTELLVLVTPRLVEPVDESPAVPTGEPETWHGKKMFLEPVPREPAGWRPGVSPGDIQDGR